MAKQNAYLARQRQLNKDYFNAGERIGMQKMLDYVYISLHEVEGFGHDRLLRLFNSLMKAVDEFHEAFTYSVEADYMQEQLDRRLRAAIGDELQPFHERYDELKRTNYNKPQKGWV